MVEVASRGTDRAEVSQRDLTIPEEVLHNPFRVAEGQLLRVVGRQSARMSHSSSGLPAVHSTHRGGEWRRRRRIKNHRRRLAGGLIVQVDGAFAIARRDETEGKHVARRYVEVGEVVR